MASLFKQPKSVFWWVKFRNQEGTLKRVSTKLRHDSVSQTKEARKLCAELTRKEQATYCDPYAEKWERWVLAFLEQRYSTQPYTLGRYVNCWRNIEAFLRKNKIEVPRALSRQHVREFIEWRQRGDKESGVFKVCKNTALIDIKILRIVLNEAVANGYVNANVCFALGIKKDAPKVKPEITDEEHAKILTALASEPEWMFRSYFLAWHQGWRFSETSLPLSRVDLAKGVAWIRLKGGKMFPAPLFPETRDFFADLITRGESVTFIKPPMTSKVWWKFLKRIGLPHLCFHCTRVSRINRLKRAGYSREARMMIVGHETIVSHEVYQRESVDPALLELVAQRGNGDGALSAENRIVRFSLQ